MLFPPSATREIDVQPPATEIVGAFRAATCASMTSPALTPAGALMVNVVEAPVSTPVFAPRTVTDGSITYGRGRVRSSRRSSSHQVPPLRRTVQRAPAMFTRAPSPERI